MRKLFTKSLVLSLTIMSIMLISTSNAQITITREDMPEAGSMVLIVIDTVTNPSPGNSGVDQTWDFSDAQESYVDTVRYLLVSEVPSAGDFDNANLVEGRILNDPSGNFYNYFFSDVRDDGVYGLGYTLSFDVPGISTFEGIATYDPDPVIVPLPLTYMLEAEETTTSHLYSRTTLMGIDLDSSYIKSSISVTQVVDGHGTIITPTGSYTALRMSENSVTIDSTFSYNESLEWELLSVDTTEQTTYHWYANDIGEVAILDEDGEINQFQYFKSSEVTDVEKLLLNVNLNLYPNPANGMLQIITDEPVKYAEIFSLNGQLLSKVQGSKNFDVSNLSAGIYIIKVYVEEGIVTRKLIKN